MNLLLPSTDGGVFLQIAILVVLTGAGLLLTRRRPESRLVVIGVFVFAAGLMGIRAIH